MVFVFRVTFSDIKATVWRRFAIANSATFWELHVVIQVLFGWDGLDAHEFIVRRIEPRATHRVSLFHTRFDDLLVVLSQETVIGDYFNEANYVGYYNYPLLTPWYLKLKLEAVTDAKPNEAYPQCLGGEGVRPADGWGGAKTYHALQKAIKNPKHPRHQQAMQLVKEDKQAPPFDKDTIMFPNPDEAYSQLCAYMQEASEDSDK